MPGASFIATISSRSYQSIIHKVCLIYFKSEADKKDSFQEIVYQLWRSFPKLKKKDKIGSWIYSIAINTSISKIRKDSRFICQESISDFSSVYDTMDKMDKNEELAWLLEAIHQLNDIDKSIMLLYLDEYNYEKIAEMIGISKSNVAIRISRSKKIIKQYLNNLDYGK